MTKRRDLDFYETPAYYVETLIKRAGILPTSRVFEPCAGDGAIAWHFEGRCWTNDIDFRRNTNYHFDAADEWPVLDPGWGWIISNPPFKQALPIVERAVERAANIAMLLRISFLEPTKQREQFLLKRPPSGIIYLPRHSFTGNGKSDMSTVAWMLWNYRLTPAIQVAPRFPA